MATAEASHRPHDRHGRRRPFSTWMRRLATLKHNATNNFHNDRKGVNENLSNKQRRDLIVKNNPYPESALPLPPLRPPRHSRGPSGITTFSQESSSIISYDDNLSARGGRVLSTRSAAPTIATNPETVNSDGGVSKTGTGPADRALSARTGGGNSTFSSPQHSQESLTTTLTTLQSTAPSAMLPNTQNVNYAPSPTQVTYATNPPHYIPPHLAPHPQTYSSAIANNMLTDNASLLTLASSSKRRRRHSLDTNASVRALAPTSLFGNSRESLPLSVLSSNIETASGVFSNTRGPMGLASAERASVYSSSGVAPVINSERNSYYAGKQPDGASIRSGLHGHGHGKTESISGSITGLTTSPLASPKEATMPGRSSRRNSDWQDTDNLNWDDDENDGHHVRRRNSDLEEEEEELQQAPPQPENKCSGKGKERMIEFDCPK